MTNLLRTLAAALAIALLAGTAASACGGDDDNTNTNTTTGAADSGDLADAPDAAADFCALYETTCGYANAFGGDPYADLNDCTTRFNGYVASRQACVSQHLGFAAGGDKATHCPHAEGADPCD